MSTKKLFNATLAATVAVTGAAAISPADAEASTNFSDVKQTDYFYEAISNLQERDIIKGFEDGSFRPNQAVTRGQVAKILAGVLGLDTTNVKDPGFKDIPKTHQYYGAIAALANAGIINGFEDGTFRQGEPVLRNHMAKMIAKGFNLQAAGTTPFTDVRADYAQYITALYTNGVTTGKTATTFDGASNVTRGQLATFVVRAENPVQTAQKEVTFTVEAVTKVGIQTAEGTLKASDAVAAVFAEGNAVALKNAQVTATVQNDEIVAVKQLTLQATSTKAAPIVFDGGKVAVDTVIVKSAFTELKNVTVNNGVVVENVAVQPVASLAPVAAELDNTAITFDQVLTPQVEVKRDGLAIHSATKLGAVVVAEGVETLELNASVGMLTVVGTPKITVAETAKVEQLVIPQGAKLQSIIANYNNVKANITSIVDTNGQKVQASTGGGGASSNTTAETKPTPEPEKEQEKQPEKEPFPETGEGKGPEADPNESGTEYPIGTVDGKEINTAGTYGPASGTEVIEGNLIVNVADVTLQNIQVTGKLILADGIQEGNVYLNNVTVAGETLVNGGGTNSIYFKDSILATVIVNKDSGAVRIVAEGKTQVVEVQLETPTIILEKELTDGATGFDDIVVTEAMAASGTAAKVQLQGVFETINSRAANVRIDVSDNSDIKTLILNAVAQVLGAGSIQTARVNVENVTFEQRPQSLVLDTNGVVTVGGQPVTESYSDVNAEATVTGMTASQGAISLEMDNFVAGLTVDDFDVVAVIVNEQTTTDSVIVSTGDSADVSTPDSAAVTTADTVELTNLKYDAAKQRFTFDPLSVEDYFGKTVEVRVTPNHDKLSKETVISAYTVTTGFGGRITDVLGVGIANLTIRFREGVGATSGDTVGVAVTDDYGYYTVNLPAGVYTGEFSSPGYVTTYMVGTALSNEFLTDQDETAVRAAASQEVKIMLTWNEYPEDLDSHLQGPGANGEDFHIFYINQKHEKNGMVYADLDLDDVTSYGPETTTIRKLVDGEYRFFVHHFSGANTLRTSGAKISVFLGNAIVPTQTFEVPAGEGNERYWDVFDLVVTENGEKVTIRPVNVLSQNRKVVKDIILEGYYWKIEVFEDMSQQEKTKAVQARVDDLELPENTNAVVSYDAANNSYVVTYQENGATKKVTIDVDFKTVTVESMIQEAYYSNGYIHLLQTATLADRLVELQNILDKVALPANVQVTVSYKSDEKQFIATYEMNGETKTVAIYPEFYVEGISDVISSSMHTFEISPGTTREQKVALVQEVLDQLELPEGIIPVVHFNEEHWVYAVDFTMNGFNDTIYIYPYFRVMDAESLIDYANFNDIVSALNDSEEDRIAHVQQIVDELPLPEGTNAHVVVNEYGYYSVEYTEDGFSKIISIYPEFVLPNALFTTNDSVYITMSSYYGYDFESLTLIPGTTADAATIAFDEYVIASYNGKPFGTVITFSQDKAAGIDLSAIEKVVIQTRNEKGELQSIEVEIAQ